MNIGDKIERNTCIICPMKRINGTYPVKWDGDEGCYVVCDPDVATYTVLACTDEEGDDINIVLAKELENRETLIDLF